MVSIQALSDADRRTLARWSAACAQRVVTLFDADDEAVGQVRDALARARAYGAGESDAATEIGKRMIAVRAAKSATTPAGAAAARAVAQASAVAHMGAHALGTAAYAVKAVSLANPDRPDCVCDEIAWQIAQLTDAEKEALRLLPPLGKDSSGPLGPGLLARGILGSTIREIQAAID
ncbi:MAG: putative immunity protein [Gordonia sp. (in: high G+C Gram-positive bacteria)]|uniref:putative immunity protein n=1 Tax=Gordonia sp. (in: high G+C Gram-positive bacteria) TaxID=84139 RepID=UPI003C723358